jgi:hypothetical protein
MPPRNLVSGCGKESQSLRRSWNFLPGRWSCCPLARNYTKEIVRSIEKLRSKRDEPLTRRFSKAFGLNPNLKSIIDKVSRKRVLEVAHLLPSPDKRS